ncbi:electron transporter RnfC, partial [Yersinia similis]|uniref:electron transporter RnfC n=1 Tax=Yersinia similis TaxID=367190 RepID=UPI0011A16342
AIARVKAKKVVQAQQVTTDVAEAGTEAPVEDPRKAAVAAAIARVKAKKAAQVINPD